MIVESYEDVVVLSGPMRKNHWGTIHTAIALTLKRHPTGVIIDCSNITEATIEGAETFHDAIDFANDHERARIIVAAVPEHVLSVLREVPEVRSQLAIADAVEEARRSLDLLTVADDEESPRKKKYLASREYDRTILAVLVGDEGDDDVVETINELVSTVPAKVIFLLPVVVPRALPLTAPIVEVEERLKASAESGKAKLSTDKTACEVRLERTRSLPTLLHEVSDNVEAAYTVVSIPHARAGDDKEMNLVQQILLEVARPVLFISGQIEPKN